MSINLPPDQTHKSKTLKASPLAFAAHALWMDLLSVPVVTGQLTRLSRPISGHYDMWQIAATLPQDIKGRFYWQDRNNQQSLLGAGIAADIRHSQHADLAQVWQTMRAVIEQSDAQFMGGLAFADRNGTGEWQGFDAIRFCLPLVEIKRVENQLTISAQLYCDSKAQWYEQFNQIRQILSVLSNKLAAKPNLQVAIQAHQYHTTEPQWQQQIDQALADIRQKTLSKVVLARATRHPLSETLQDFELAERWQSKMPDAFAFLMNFGEASFIGFSPERLLRIRGQEFATESLAGTQPRGETEAQDQQFESVLVNNRKLIHEHQLVTDYIARKLAPFTHHYVADAEVNILKLPNVQHRQAGFRGQMRNSEESAELFRSLFPTPAVCGLPKSHAYRHIQQAENFQRGWYAGTVGVFGAQSCEFSVAIRSALLNSNEITSYAGAGIVEGSEANTEWCELNDKASIIEKILS